MGLIAVEPMFRNSEKQGVIIHKNVIEVLPKKTANRRFKCLCCKKEWVETINSPQIVEEEVANNLKAYYHEPTQTCVEFYKVIEDDLRKEGIILENL